MEKNETPLLSSELYDYKALAPKVTRLKNYFPKTYKHQFEYKKLDQVMSQQDPFKPAPSSKSGVPTRFTEKHLIESLQVSAADNQKPVMFYSMLNQGNKRGK